MADLSLASADYAESMKFNGKLDNSLEMGSDNACAQCELLVYDPRHTGRLEMEVDGVVDPVRYIDFRSAAPRTIKDDFAPEISRVFNVDVEILPGGDDVTGHVLILTSREPGASENKKKFIGKDSATTVIDTPCFGKNQIVQQGSKRPGGKTDYKVVLNGVEFTAEDIGILREIIDERKSLEHFV